MENITTLKEALDNLYQSKEYKALCEVVLDMRKKDIQVDSPTIERMIDDTLICRGAWIYDEVVMKPNKRGKTMLQKIRKVLGYTYP